jgi:hypothetical protein
VDKESGWKERGKPKVELGTVRALGAVKGGWRREKSRWGIKVMTDGSKIWGGGGRRSA